MTNRQRSSREPGSTLGPAFLIFAAAVALIGLLLLPVAQGLAGYLGGSWQWPSGHVPAAIGHLLAGHPGYGLDPTAPSIPAWRVWVSAALVELVPAAAWAGLVVGWWRIGRGGDDDGFASRQQARDVLGVSRLHDGRRQIRPDLYGQRAARSAFAETQVPQW